MSDSKTGDFFTKLLDITLEMNNTGALEPLLTYAVDVSIDFLNGLYGFLVLLDQDGELEFAVARDHQGNNVDNPDLQISQTIIYKVIQEKEFVVTASAITEAEFREAESVGILGLKSVLCVPLISLGHVIGVIYLENRIKSEVFTKEDAHQLMYLAGHAAVCIQNAMLSDELAASRDKVLKLSTAHKLSAETVETVRHAVEEERSRLLYAFIQDTSHQFRTPLSVIRTSVDILKRKIDLAVAGNYLERIQGQIDVIVELVDSLNLLAKLDAETEHSMVKEDLGLLVQDVWDVMHQPALARQIKMNYTAPDNRIPVVLIQRHARTAISKVLTNAVNFTEDGGNITLSVAENDIAAMIIIEDNGIGISEEDLPHVKDRFFKVDQSGKLRGLGLGLSIADRIMAVHGGSLRIESDLGVGTRVTLIFQKT